MENLDLTKILKVGDKVYSDTFGYGKVEKISNGEMYPIFIDFDGRHIDFTGGGKYIFVSTDTGCSIFPSKENRDWNSVIVNQKERFIVSLNGEFWAVHEYSSDEVEQIKENKYNTPFQFIVPAELFDMTVGDLKLNIVHSLINGDSKESVVGDKYVNETTLISSTEASKPTEERQSKYKVGDTVKIKSEKWYDDNAFVSGNVYPVGIIGETNYFIPEMSEYCGKTAKITKVLKDNWYMLDFEEDHDFEEDYYTWSDWMFENSVEKISTPYVDGFYPVGKELELHDGTIVRIEANNLCMGCIYQEHFICKHLGKNKKCDGVRREDGNSVIFKKIN